MHLGDDWLFLDYLFTVSNVQSSRFLNAAPGKVLKLITSICITQRLLQMSY